MLGQKYHYLMSLKDDVLIYQVSELEGYFNVEKVEDSQNIMFIAKTFKLNVSLWWDHVQDRE